MNARADFSNARALGLFKIQVGPSSIEIDASGIRIKAPKIDLN